MNLFIIICFDMRFPKFRCCFFLRNVQTPCNKFCVDEEKVHAQTVLIFRIFSQRVHFFCTKSFDASAGMMESGDNDNSVGEQYSDGYDEYEDGESGDDPSLPPRPKSSVPLAAPVKLEPPKVKTVAIVDSSQPPPAVPSRAKQLSVDGELGTSSSFGGPQGPPPGVNIPPRTAAGKAKAYIFKMLGRSHDPIYNPIDRYDEEGIHGKSMNTEGRVSPGFVKIADQFADFILLIVRYIMLILRIALDIAIAVIVGLLELMVHLFNALFIRGIDIVGNKILKPLYHSCFHDCAHPFLVYTWSVFNGLKSASEPLFGCFAQGINACLGPCGLCFAKFLNIRVDYKSAGTDSAAGNV